jgi:hypothetical protein
MNKNSVLITLNHDGSANRIACMRRMEQSALLAIERILANITARGADRQEYEPVIEQSRNSPLGPMSALHIARGKVLCIIVFLLSLTALILSARMESS